MLGGFEDVGAKAVIQRCNDDVVELAGIVPIRTDRSGQHVGSPRFFRDKQLPTVFVVNSNKVRIVRRIGRRRLGLFGHSLSRARTRCGEFYRRICRPRRRSLQRDTAAVLECDGAHVLKVTLYTGRRD